MVGKKLWWAGLAALGLAAGCGNPVVTTLGGQPSGDDTSSSTPPPSTPPPGSNASISVSPATFSIDLADTQNLTFTVTGFNGFSGDVTVTVASLPTGLSAATPTTTVTIASANGTANGMIAIKSDNTTVLPGTYNAATLTATAVSDGSISDMKNPAITVNPKITLQTATSKTGGCGFWDAVADYKLDAGSGKCIGNGTVVHLGNATAITVRWVKNFNSGTEQHRVHANGGSGFQYASLAAADADALNRAKNQTGSVTAVKSIGGATACELDGLFTHSGQCSNPAAGSGTDETGNGNGTVFERTLQPADPTKVTVVTYYDHLTGSADFTPASLSAAITIAP